MANMTPKFNIDHILTTRDKTLIIFDWDDTLYPTSWITKNGIDLTDPKSRYKHMGYFDKLDKYLSHLIKNANKLGQTIIITNAMPEWIELSLTVLPRLAKLIIDIKIISARKNYQHMSDMANWKVLAFRDYITKSNTKYANIISLGDAEYEHNALINLYKWDKLPHKYLKSIKFMRSIDYDVVMKQLDIMSKYMSSIVSAKRHLDLTFDLV